ncbi:MAG: hypothetical protein N3A54_00805 [Patescibacteria group bacterium]|nr:hypothetical protein [Patescibacteria group bacterium]
MKTDLLEYNIENQKKLFGEFFTQIAERLELEDEITNLDYFIKEYDNMIFSLYSKYTEQPPDKIIKDSFMTYTLSKLKGKIIEIMKEDGVGKEGKIPPKTSRKIQDEANRFLHHFPGLVYLTAYCSENKIWDLAFKEGFLEEKEIKRLKDEFFSLSYDELKSIAITLSESFDKLSLFYYKHNIKYLIHPIAEGKTSTIYKINNYKECRTLGADTHWCTASSSGEAHVKRYQLWSFLYVILVDGSKYHLALNKIFDVPKSEEERKNIAAFYKYMEMIWEAYRTHDISYKSLENGVLFNFFRQAEKPKLVNLSHLHDSKFYQIDKAKEIVKEFFVSYFYENIDSLLNSTEDAPFLFFSSLLSGNEDLLEMKFCDYDKKLFKKMKNFMYELNDRDDVPVPISIEAFFSSMDVGSIKDVPLESFVEFLKVDSIRFSYHNLLKAMEMFKSISVADKFREYRIAESKLLDKAVRDERISSFLKLYSKLVRNIETTDTSDFYVLVMKYIPELLSRVSSALEDYVKLLVLNNYKFINLKKIEFEKMKVAEEDGFLNEFYKIVINTYKKIDVDTIENTSVIYKEEDENVTRMTIEIHDKKDEDLLKVLFSEKFNMAVMQLTSAYTLFDRKYILYLKENQRSDACFLSYDSTVRTEDDLINFFEKRITKDQIKALKRESLVSIGHVKDIDLIYKKFVQELEAFDIEKALKDEYARNSVRRARTVFSIFSFYFPYKMFSDFEKDFLNSRVKISIDLVGNASAEAAELLNHKNRSSGLVPVAFVPFNREPKKTDYRELISRYSKNMRVLFDENPYLPTMLEMFYVDSTMNKNLLMKILKKMYYHILNSEPEVINELSQIGMSSYEEFEKYSEGFLTLLYYLSATVENGLVIGMMDLVHKQHPDLYKKFMDFISKLYEDAETPEITSILSFLYTTSMYLMRDSVFLKDVMKMLVQKKDSIEILKPADQQEEEK